MVQFSCPGLAQLDDFLDWLDIDVDDEPDDERLTLKFEPNESDAPVETEQCVLIESGEHTLDILKLFDANNKDLKKLATIPNIERGLRSSCTLFKYKNKLLAILDTDSNSSAEVTELLRPYAELAKDVTIVHIKHILQYKGTVPKKELESDTNFIRGINSKLDYVEELLPPNMISGAAAGIASLRSLKEQPVCSYVFFTHKFNALEMLHFLNDLKVDGLKKPTDLLDEQSHVVKRPYI